MTDEPTLLPDDDDSAPLVDQSLVFERLDETADIDVVRKADINIFNFQLTTLSTAYKHVKSIGGLIALNKEVREMIKTRRDILGLPYGAATNKTSRTLVYEPLS